MAGWATYRWRPKAMRTRSCKKKTPSELLSRGHRVASLLKRWLIGTHQGAVSHKHLEYYLDEFTFRFNRRRSKSRGKLFFRLAQQALAVDPVTYDGIVHPTSGKVRVKPQSVGRGYLSEGDTPPSVILGSLPTTLSGAKFLIYCCTTRSALALSKDK